MAYATGTLTSGTPAKDLMAAVATPLTTAGMTLVETYSPPTAGQWQAMAFGNGVFVAVGASMATAATSTDGITWTARSLPANANWLGVIYGGGQFFAFTYSGNVAATSPDGITWTLRTLPVSTTWQTAAYGNGTFVVVANSSAIAATSTDGITWTQRTMPTSSTWYAAAYGAGLFVVLCNSGSTLSTSPDGITWTNRTGTSGGWRNLIFAGGIFLAVQGSSTAITSTDGITWSTRTMSASSTWSGLAYGNGTFLATNAAGTTAASTSSDGTTWTARTLPTAGTWTWAAYGNGTFATVAYNTTVAATSPDGATWTQRVMPNHSESPTVDVWKSPAASNTLGSDWYLLLRRIGDLSLLLYYQVAEQYNASTHRASNLGGVGNSSTPTAILYANPATSLSPELTTTFGSAATVTLTNTQFSYIVSASANRFVLGIKTSAEFGFYCGLYEDLLPTGTTQFPLVAARIPTSATGSLSIGYGNVIGAGGFTREPLQTASSFQNFESAIHLASIATAGGTVVTAAMIGFTPMTTTGALYGNTTSLSRVPVGSLRAANFSDALRGLLIGMVMSSQASVVGDTITAGGKTYVRIAGPTSTLGYFVDQAL